MEIPLPPRFLSTITISTDHKTLFSEHKDRRMPRQKESSDEHSSSEEVEKEKSLLEKLEQETGCSIKFLIEKKFPTGEVPVLIEADTALKLVAGHDAIIRVVSSCFFLKYHLCFTDFCTFFIQQFS